MADTAAQTPQFSLAKDKIKVLLLEGINDSAVELMQSRRLYQHRASAQGARGRRAQRSRRRASTFSASAPAPSSTEDVFGAADRLIAIGCFNVGTNQVDLDAARRIGVPVFNAPFSNTRSVAELVIGEIVMLLRRIFPRSVAAHSGGWDKSATDSHEVSGKTLGIVGYGNIGSQLSYLAEAMGMRVIFYDLTDKLRHGNTEPSASLDDLLRQSDVVSLHVPETPAT